MAEQPNVQIISPNISGGTSLCTSTPQKLDGIFGKTIVSLYDLNNTGARMVLRIKDTDFPTTTLATLRQYPNSEGYAHFDISEILKRNITWNENYYKFDGDDIYRHITEGNSYPLYIRFESGYENVANQPVIINSAFTENIVYLPSRKKYYELVKDFTPYRTQGFLSDDGTDFTGGTITQECKAWTDFNEVYKIKIGSNENYSLTFNTSMEISNPDVCDDCLFKRITANNFRVRYLQGSTVVGTDYFYNGTGIPQDWGDVVCDSLTELMTFRCGTNNSTINASISSLNADGYIVDMVMRFQFGPVIPDFVMSKPYYFEIVDLECNDFEPLQFTWVNSLGFVDHYTFKKRKDYSINITREEFRRDTGNFNEAVFNIDQSERGLTQYAGKLEENYSVSTDFLTDDEAVFLKNLFISPNVSVNMGGEYYPINITNATYTERTFRKDRLFQYKIDFKMSNNLNNQVI